MHDAFQLPFSGSELLIPGPRPIFIRRRRVIASREYVAKLSATIYGKGLTAIQIQQKNLCRYEQVAHERSVLCFSENT